MKKRWMLSLLTLVTLTGLFSLAGCLNRIVGSGTLETREYDFTGFTRIEVSNAFAVDVVKSTDYGVSITLNDNLFDVLDISVTGETLRIGMKNFTGIINSTQKAEISLPDLEALVISGASRGTVTGFDLNHPLNIEVSGASRVETVDIKTTDATVTVTGASRLAGGFTATGIEFMISGASVVELDGTAATVEADVSGASRARLADFTIADASFNVSGASSAEIVVMSKLDVVISGASNLTYSGSPTLGRVDVSGASSLNRRP